MNSSHILNSSQMLKLLYSLLPSFLFNFFGSEKHSFHYLQYIYLFDQSVDLFGWCDPSSSCSSPLSLLSSYPGPQSQGLTVPPCGSPTPPLPCIFSICLPPPRASPALTLHKPLSLVPHEKEERKWPLRRFQS